MGYILIAGQSSLYSALHIFAIFRGYLCSGFSFGVFSGDISRGHLQSGFPPGDLLVRFPLCEFFGRGILSLLPLYRFSALPFFRPQPVRPPGAPPLPPSVPPGFTFALAEDRGWLRPIQGLPVRGNRGGREEEPLTSNG